MCVNWNLIVKQYPTTQFNADRHTLQFSCSERRKKRDTRELNGKELNRFTIFLLPVAPGKTELTAATNSK